MRLRMVWLTRCRCFLQKILLFFAVSSLASAQSVFVRQWLDHVTRIQNEEPHWISPLIMTTPRLEQKFREDVTRQSVQGGHANWLYNYNAKGVEFVPVRPIAITLNVVPPYLEHGAPKTQDGFGDINFLLKYRFVTRNEAKGNYVISSYVGASVPTGSHQNGSNSATITPTVAGGKGWGRFNLESSLGGTLPVNSVKTVGRSITWNGVAEYHIGRYWWPEVESNATYFKGGPYDGKTQEFLTPGLLLGRLPFHNRTGLTLGVGMQIATSHYYSYNHAVLISGRVAFYLTFACAHCAEKHATRQKIFLFPVRPRKIYFTSYRINTYISEHMSIDVSLLSG